MNKEKDFEKMKELLGTEILGKLVSSGANNPCLIIPIVTFLISKKIPFTLTFTPETQNNFGKVVLNITLSQKFSFSFTWTFD